MRKRILKPRSVILEERELKNNLRQEKVLKALDRHYQREAERKLWWDEAADKWRRKPEHIKQAMRDAAKAERDRP